MKNVLPAGTYIARELCLGVIETVAAHHCKPADVQAARSRFLSALRTLLGAIIPHPSVAVVGALTVSGILSQASLGDDSQTAVDAFVPYAQFKIPFNLEANTSRSMQVQLWVSVDDGTSWQMVRSVAADAKQFDFRAAEEGTYLFRVQTIDGTGTMFPSPAPPMRVVVDTTKPLAAIQADINERGQLVIDVRALDENLEPATAQLRMRADSESSWRDLPLEFERTGDRFDAKVVVDVPTCHEIALIFSVLDSAKNSAEATFAYSMPRTAVGEQGMTLASTRSDENSLAGNNDNQVRRSLPGAMQWKPTTSPPSATLPVTAAIGPQSSPAVGRQQVSSQEVDSANKPPSFSPTVTQHPSLARLASEGQLSLEPQPTTLGLPEELPLPKPLESNVAPTQQTAPHYVSSGADAEQPATSELSLGSSASVQDLLKPSTSEGTEPETMPNKSTDSVAAGTNGAQAATTSRAELLDRSLDRFSGSDVNLSKAYHCRSQAFSLDYSVQAMGGSSLSDVELWGTEDNGITWQKWGSDPDRQSPFDVQVGNDGLFGFRMVVVGANGIVSNLPRSGDLADVWINVDTKPPTLHIDRAVYGEGPEDGLLIIDYQCRDDHLVEQPIALSFSQRPDGPWNSIATGLANTGVYLWKATAGLPEKVYLRVEGVDKAGNVGVHRLDLPVDIAGMAPRGIIQGFRPIDLPK